MISEALYAVLEGKEQFLNRGYLSYYDEPPMAEYQYCDEINDGSETYATRQFAIVDMDGDGTNEVVLLGDSGRDGAYTVLHEYDGKVYGHMVVYRGMSSLLRNGLFGESNGADSFIISRFDYNGADCDITELAGGEYGQFHIGEREVTEQEYDSYLTQIGWDWSDEAVFYAYTDDNILSLLAP